MCVKASVCKSLCVKACVPSFRACCQCQSIFFSQMVFLSVCMICMFRNDPVFVFQNEPSTRRYERCRVFVCIYVLSGCVSLLVPTLTANGTAIPWKLWDSHRVRPVRCTASKVPLHHHTSDSRAMVNVDGSKSLGPSSETRHEMTMKIRSELQGLMMVKWWLNMVK